MIRKIFKERFMKAEDAMKEFSKLSPKGEEWFWVKPTSGYVEELSTSEEWELMGVVDSLWGSDPAEVVGLFELGNPFEGSD